MGKLHPHQNDREDFYQYASIGLLKAIRTWNKAKGAKFITYATRCIQNEMTDYFLVNMRLRTKQASTIRGSVGFQPPLYTELLESLSDTDKIILALHLKRWDYIEIGQLFGYGKSWANRRLRAAVEKMVG